MSQREDLERLAEECEECALEADESIDEHLIVCQSCVDQVHKAEEIEHHVHHMEDLSMEPDQARQDVFFQDIEGFMQLSEEERQEAMTDMFDTFADLNEAQRTALIKTRTDIMTSLPKGEREKYVATARSVYSSYDFDRKVMEEQAIITATSDYNPLKRTMVRRMYRNMMK
jgi:hypothetical protein